MNNEYAYFEFILGIFFTSMERTIKAKLLYIIDAIVSKA